MTLEERADVQAIAEGIHARFPGKDVLSAEDFAAYLGVTRMFVCNKIAARELPGQKIGGKFLIPLHSVALWENRLAKTQKESEY